MIKNISFFVWDFFFVGIMAAIKNPIAETNLPKIQKVVALLALTFSTKKSGIPLKLKVWNMSIIPIVKKTLPKKTVLKFRVWS